MAGKKHRESVDSSDEAMDELAPLGACETKGAERKGVTFTPEVTAKLDFGGLVSPAQEDGIMRKLAFKTKDAQTPGRYAKRHKTGKPLQVFLRVRPQDDSEECEIDIENDMSIALQAPSDSQAFKFGESTARYTFSRVFSQDSTQLEVFEHVAAPLVDSFFAGQNGLIFAYGITNSGKTHTMQGSPQDPGVIPRVLQRVFDRLADDEAEDGSEPPFRVVASYLEIYNEKIYDLLPDTAANGGKGGRGKAKGKTCSLKNSGGDSVFVSGLQEVSINTHQEAFVIFKKGQKKRTLGTTDLNSDSSRSHSVFNIKLVTQDGGVWSRLSLVDLAGSERVKRTNTSGARLQEALKINTSLVTLGRCLEALRHNQMLSSESSGSNNKNEKIVPFRDSKITRLFKDSLMGWGRTVMIANVNPSAVDYDETMHALKYASIAKEIRLAPRIDSRRPAAAAYDSNGRRVGTARKHRRNNSSTAASLFSQQQRQQQQQQQQQQKPDPRKQSVLPSLADDFETAQAALNFDGVEDNDDEVDQLLDQVFNLKKQLISAEQRCAAVEATVRDEVCEEMEEQMLEMEEMWSERLQQERHMAEEKFQRKLAIMQKRMLGEENASGASSAGSADQDRMREVIASQEKAHELSRQRIEAQHARELGDFEKELVDANEERARLGQANADLAQRLNALQTELQDVRREGAEQQGEVLAGLEEAEEDLLAETARADALQARVQAVESLLREQAMAQTHTKQSAADEVRDLRDELKTAKKNAAADRRELRKREKAAEQLEKELEAQSKDAREKIASLRDQLQRDKNGHKQAVDALEEEVATLRKEQSISSQKYIGVQAKGKHLAEQLEKLQDQLDKLKEDKAERTKEIRALKTQAKRATADHKKAVAKAAREHKKELRDALKTQGAELQEARARAEEQEIAALQRQLDQAEAKLEEAEAKLAESEEAANVLKAEKKEASDACDALERQQATADSQRVGMEKETASLQQRLDAALEQATEATAELKKARAEAKKAATAAKKDAAKADKAAKKAVSDADKAKAKAEKALQSEEDKVAALQAEVEAAKEAAKEAKAAVQKATDEASAAVERAEQEAKDAKKAVKQAVKQAEAKAKAEAADAKAQIAAAEAKAEAEAAAAAEAKAEAEAAAKAKAEAAAAKAKAEAAAAEAKAEAAAAKAKAEAAAAEAKAEAAAAEAKAEAAAAEAKAEAAAAEAKAEAAAAAAKETVVAAVEKQEAPAKKPVRNSRARRGRKQAPEPEPEPEDEPEVFDFPDMDDMDGMDGMGMEGEEEEQEEAEQVEEPKPETPKPKARARRGRAAAKKKEEEVEVQPKPRATRRRRAAAAKAKAEEVEREPASPVSSAVEEEEAAPVEPTPEPKRRTATRRKGGKRKSQSPPAVSSSPVVEEAELDKENATPPPAKRSRPSMSSKPKARGGKKAGGARLKKGGYGRSKARKFGKAGKSQASAFEKAWMSLLTPVKSKSKSCEDPFAASSGMMSPVPLQSRNMAPPSTNGKRRAHSSSGRSRARKARR